MRLFTCSVRCKNCGVEVIHSEHIPEELKKVFVEQAAFGENVEIYWFEETWRGLVPVEVSA